MKPHSLVMKLLDFGLSLVMKLQPFLTGKLHPSSVGLVLRGIALGLAYFFMARMAFIAGAAAAAFIALRMAAFFFMTRMAFIAGAASAAFLAFMAFMAFFFFMTRMAFMAGAAAAAFIALRMAAFFFMTRMAFMAAIAPM